MRPKDTRHVLCGSQRPGPEILFAALASLAFRQPLVVNSEEL